MDVRFLIGAHRAATKHLQETLYQNWALLEKQEICLPEADIMQRALYAALRGIRNGADKEKITSDLLSKLTQDREYKRIVLISPRISGTVTSPAKDNLLYPRAGLRVSSVANMLEHLPMRLFVAIRNPATFLPSCYSSSLDGEGSKSFEDFAEQSSPTQLRWSDYMHRVQGKGSGIPITTWRFEDYPYFWREIAQAITGIENKEELHGTTSPVNQGISLHGAMSMYNYLQAHQVSDPDALAKIRQSFFEKFPSEPQGSVPQCWPEELSSGLTDNYDDDWYYIERMDNVDALQPIQYS